MDPVDDILSFWSYHFFRNLEHRAVLDFVSLIGLLNSFYFSATPIRGL